MSNQILAIDIGSTKICAIIAEIDNGKIRILGHGITQSHGIKKGAITNIELISKTIKKVVLDAKRIAGSNINTATVSISNVYAKSLNSTGVVNIPHPNKNISIKDIRRVIDAAVYNAKILTEYETIHILPYNFRVDEQDSVEDPFGMNASRLEVDVNIIVTQSSNLSNLQNAVSSAGIEIDGIVLSGYASSIAVMNDDDKEMGVAVIDLGGETSNLVIHAGNSIRYSDFLAVGSNHITNDLSIGLGTPLRVAEGVKKKYGNLMEITNEEIELPKKGDQTNLKGVSLEKVHNIIYSRVEETLLLLERSLRNSTLKRKIGSGIIFTGGMTKLKGFREFAEQIFQGFSVRIGMPRKIEGLFDELNDPAYATIVGLILYKAGEHTPYEIDFQQELLHSKVNYEEDLGDIRITKTIHDVEEQKATQRESIQMESGTTQGSAVSFQDLPVVQEENNNPLRKFFYWIKQLF